MATDDAKEKLETYLMYAPRPIGLIWTLEREVRFHPVRRWRFDYAYVDQRGDPVKIAVEYDGIMHRTVGHNSLGGILRDSEKSNEAQRLGWRVFRANAKNIEDGTFFTLIDDVLVNEARIAA